MTLVSVWDYRAHNFARTNLTCDHCGCIIEQGEEFIGGWRYLCRDCAEELYICNQCECEFEDYEELCPECEVEHVHRHLNNYNFKPFPIFEFNENRHNKVHIGAELEVDSTGSINVNNTCELLDSIMDLDLDCFDTVYCKHDGSLGADGVEIVTHPMTADSLKKVLCDYANKFFNLGYRSHDTTTCGLHFHIDREFFGNTSDPLDFDIFRLKAVLLVERLYLDSRMGEFDRRRNRYNYCQKVLSESDLKERDFIKKIIKSKSKTDRADRYSLVNINNRNTIEFRFFKGTLNPETIKANIDFIALLADLIKTITPQKAGNFTFNKLITHLTKNKETYSDLYNYFVMKGWC